MKAHEFDAKFEADEDVREDLDRKRNNNHTLRHGCCFV